MLSSSRWQEDIKLKFIPQLRAFPPKIHNLLLFFIYFSFSFSFLFWPFCTHHHISARFWDVTDTMIEERSTKNDYAYFFYFNDKSGKRPRWNIYYTKHILLRRKLTREALGNYMYLQYADLPFPISVEHLWVILPTFLAYDWLFEIQHLNFRYVHLYLCSQWAALTRHFEIKMPVALFNGNWQKARFWFICLVLGIIYLNHTTSCKLFKFYKNNSSN